MMPRRNRWQWFPRLHMVCLSLVYRHINPFMSVVPNTTLAETIFWKYLKEQTTETPLELFFQFRINFIVIFKNIRGFEENSPRKSPSIISLTPSPLRNMSVNCNQKHVRKHEWVKYDSRVISGAEVDSLCVAWLKMMHFLWFCQQYHSSRWWLSG